MWWEIHVEVILRVTENSKNLSSVSLIEKIPFTGRSVTPSQILFHKNKFASIFVPKFYHDKRDTNFLKFLSYVGEHGPDNLRCEYLQIGRKLHEYKKKTAGSSARSIQSTDLD